MSQNVKYLTLLGVWFPLVFVFIKVTPVLAQTKLPVQSVTASGFQEPNEPANTLDGSLGTRWSSEGDGEWIQYDFGTPQTISQVFIAWYRGDLRTADFTIQVSMNAATWTDVFNGRSSGRTLGLQPYNIADVPARYVRIVGFGNTENDWNSITEVEIHGPSAHDNRLDVVAVIASEFQDPNVPTNTLDQNLSTRWSAEGDGQWIRYDLGESKTISQMLIAWYRGDVRLARFDIEISPDASQWRQVFSGASSGTAVSLQTYDFSDVMAQYVRIVGHGNTENMWNSITEVELHGASEEPNNRVDLIGVVPDSFSTNGGMFELSVVLRDEQGDIITSGVTRENFTFQNITVSLNSMPEDIVTNGRADVTNIEILQTAEGEQVTVVLDFDSSGSMGPNAFDPIGNDPNRLRVDAGIQLISLLKPTDQAAIMDFGAGTTAGFRASRLLQNFTSDKALLNQAIDSVVASGGTPLFDSILDALDLFVQAPPSSNPAVVVLTDGEDTESSNTPLDVIQQAQQQSIQIFTIGLGRGIGFPPLQNIARETGGTFVEAVDADALIQLFQAIGVGIVAGRVVVSGEGVFDPPLTNTGAYIVSGTLVTTLSGQFFNTPFGFLVEVGEQTSPPPPPLPPPPP
jgi:hypothetical protein